MAGLEGDKAYELAVAELDREIEDLQRARDTLLRRIGQSRGEVSTSPTASSAGVVSGDPLVVVREQEFSGMSWAKAARAFLQRIGRNEKTATIIAALRKGGVEVSGKNPVSSLYTTLSRHSAFVPLGRNYWDLAERRPDLVGTKKKSRRVGKRSTAGRKKPKNKEVVLTRATPDVTEMSDKRKAAS